MARLNNPDYNRANNIHEFSVRNLIGEPEVTKLDKYKGSLCIIVNIATKSKLTGENYKLLNELMDNFGDSNNLRILAFPCDQFGDDSGSAEEIVSHAEQHNVKFDIFAKVDVNGQEASPLWSYLKYSHSGKGKHGDVIKTNYTKFIINRAGMPVERYGPEVAGAQFEECLIRYF